MTKQPTLREQVARLRQDLGLARKESDQLRVKLEDIPDEARALGLILNIIEQYLTEGTRTTGRNVKRTEISRMLVNAGQAFGVFLEPVRPQETTLSQPDEWESILRSELEELRAKAADSEPAKTIVLNL